jgi:thiol-disulfide isomerase/thioredoxin
VTAALVACVLMVAANAAPVAGQAAPRLVAKLFDGRDLDLATLRGHVIVLNFWASWCVPCRQELPLLDTLAREYGGRGLMVIGLSADDPHDRGAALKAAHGLGYDLGLLSDARSNEFGPPLTIPLTYVIAADGVVSAVLRAGRGALGADQLRAAIEKDLP